MLLASPALTARARKTADRAAELFRCSQDDLARGFAAFQSPLRFRRFRQRKNFINVQTEPALANPLQYIVCSCPPVDNQISSQIMRQPLRFSDERDSQSRNDQRALARRISSFRRMLRSSTDRAPSAPTTGRPPDCRSPSCTNTEAWSQYMCSCAILSPSNCTTTTSATSTRFPVGWMPGSIQSIGIVWVNRTTISSTSLPWPMVRDTGTTSKSGGIWVKQYLA